jgi:hypothetical protein
MLCISSCQDAWRSIICYVLLVPWLKINRTVDVVLVSSLVFPLSLVCPMHFLKLYFKWIKSNICLPLSSKHAMYFCRYQTTFCFNPHGIWWKLSEPVQNFWIITSKNIKAKLITDIQLQVRTCWSSFPYSHVVPIFWSLMPGNLSLVMDIYIV